MQAYKRCGFDPWAEKIPWKRAWQPTKVFLPGKSHGHFRAFYVEDHVLCKQWEFYFFFSNSDSFYFFFCSAVAKTSKTMLNSSDENWHSCLVLEFRGNAFNFSLLRIMFAVSLSYIAFIMLRYVISIPAFWRIFFFLS